MCVSVEIKSTKEELQDFFKEYNSSFDFESICNGLPLEEFPVYTENGFENLIWGEKNDKLKIHLYNKELDFKNYKRGVIAVTGFYILKKQNAPAPIGFGDHRETTKFTQYFVKRKDDNLILFPVMINEKSNSFFIVMHNAKEWIKGYQEKEPMILFHHEGWIKNLDVITTALNSNEFEMI